MLVVRECTYQPAGCMTRCVGHKVMSGWSEGPEAAERGLMTGPSVRAGGAARRNVEGSTHGAIPPPDRETARHPTEATGQQVGARPCLECAGAYARGPEAATPCSSSARLAAPGSARRTSRSRLRPQSACRERAQRTCRPTDSGSFRVMKGDSIGHGRTNLPMSMGAPRVTADGSCAAPVQRRTSKHGLGRGCGCRR